MGSPTVQPVPETAAPAGAEERRPFRLDVRWLVIVPALVVFLTYLPALQYGFVWDDTIFLRDLPAYRDPALWLSSLFGPFLLSPNYFRPLAVLTFVGELRLAGLNPTLFHLTNLLLHALNTALVSLLAMRLLARKSASSQPPIVFPLAVGLFYGLHPALAEGVAFISSRFDLLMTALLLLAFLADVDLRGRRSRPWLVGLAFLLAALSKEMALSFALALPFWHIASREEPAPKLAGMWKRIRENGDLWVYIAVLGAGLLYLVIRAACLGHLLTSVSGNIPSTGSLLQHFLLVVKSLAGYVVLLVWPFTTLSPIHYSQSPIPLSDALAWLGLVLDGLLIFGLVQWVRRAPRSGWLAVGAALAMLPVINVVRLELGGGAFIAERYLVFPLALLLLAGGLALSSLYRPEALAAVRIPWKQALPALWLVASLATVQLTLPNWRDNMTLWVWASARAPESATPPTNLALEFVDRGMPQQGLQLAQQATNLDPQNADAWDNTGLALFYLGKYPEAQAAFEKAVGLQPESALFWNNLAGALREQDMLADAEKVLLDEVLRRDPNLPIAHVNLGIVYLRADRPDLASQHLAEALRLLPPDQAGTAQALLEQAKDPQIWLRLGALLLSNGDPQGAARAYQQAGTFGAAQADVAIGLSSALIAAKDWQNAAQVLNQALQNAQSATDATTTEQAARLYNNLGIVAREQGETDQARQLFQKAVELAPDWAEPQQNLQALPQK